MQCYMFIGQLWHMVKTAECELVLDCFSRLVSTVIIVFAHYYATSIIIFYSSVFHPAEITAQ